MYDDEYEYEPKNSALSEVMGAIFQHLGDTEDKWAKRYKELEREYKYDMEKSRDTIKHWRGDCELAEAALEKLQKENYKLKVEAGIIPPPEESINANL